ncbi:rhodanese-like domain-containing protein [Endozoicomonas ascidiicola]|uniref:rhodanese-like domain-containing protein n=1 Tax=Endozoicomonas ascidiicola TaxID=1698521 RepID=UPI0008309D57|nr:rhodanese-like domain-containing protein [Endozoicomonas ascidiicola]
MIDKLRQFTLSLFVFLGLVSNASADSPASNIWESINNGALLIDVRTQQEYNSGHIERSIHIPHQLIVERIGEKMVPYDTEIILYCKSGRRSGIAQEMLMKHGYSNVVNAGAYQQLLDEQP